MHTWIILTNYIYSYLRNFQYNAATHISYSLQYNNSCLRYLQYNSILPQVLLDTTSTTEYHCYYFSSLIIHHTILTQKLLLRVNSN